MNQEDYDKQDGWHQEQVRVNKRPVIERDPKVWEWLLDKVGIKDPAARQNLPYVLLMKGSDTHRELEVILKLTPP